MATVRDLSGNTNYLDEHIPTPGGESGGGGGGGGDASAANQLLMLSRVGEVQADPTANTILARLKDILTEVVLNTGANTIGSVVLKDSGDNEIIFLDPSEGTVAGVASSATAVPILAANAQRKGASIWNNSTQSLFLNLSVADPTTAVATVEVPSEAYYEVPFGYTGEINGIWTSANGNAIVTELV